MLHFPKIIFLFFKNIRKNHLQTLATTGFITKKQMFSKKRNMFSFENILMGNAVPLAPQFRNTDIISSVGRVEERNPTNAKRAFDVDLDMITIVNTLAGLFMVNY